MGGDIAKLLEGESASETFQSKLLTQISHISMESVLWQFLEIRVFLHFYSNEFILWMEIYNLNQIRQPYSGKLFCSLSCSNLLSISGKQLAAPLTTVRA